MEQIVILDYGSGNIPSVEKALLRSAQLIEKDVSILVTDKPGDLRKADRILIPGVGHFQDCKKALDKRAGVIEALNEASLHNGKPTLGICVGMQLMADMGLEGTQTPGLGWISGEVRAIDAKTERVPHMGWNELEITAQKHPVLDGIKNHDHAYFVHSFGFAPTNTSRITAKVQYGSSIVAAIARDNLFGVQFHPEKSQTTGLKLLANWINWQV